LVALGCGVGVADGISVGEAVALGCGVALGSTASVGITTIRVSVGVQAAVMHKRISEAMK